jgi:hypothetical protein
MAPDVDPWLVNAMPGEGRCNHVLVVKAHPTLTRPVELFQPPQGLISPAMLCAPFTRAIVLMRDFFLATFAEFQRNTLASLVRAGR